jgi:hypothetical protein
VSKAYIAESMSLDGFRPAMQGIGILVGTVSRASIVGLAWSTGSYNQVRSRVVVADSIGVLCLLVAAGLRVIGPRGR